MTNFYALLAFWLMCVSIGVMGGLICMTVFLAIRSAAAKRFFKDDWL